MNGTDLDSKAGTFHYQPSTNTVSATTFDGALTGTAAKVTVTNDNSDTNASTLAIPYVNGTDLDSKAGTFHYQPSTGTITAAKFSGDGSAITHLNFEESNNSGKVPVDHGGTGLATIGTNHILLGNGTLAMTTIAPESDPNTAKFLSSYNGGNLAWTSPSVSGISITNDNLSATGQGITFAAGVNAQTIKSDQSTLHYKPSTGTLTTSNLITSDTSTSARNGIANTAPTSTFSVGTVFSIQEWDGSGDPIDVMVVRKGNAFYEGNVYIGKTLTVPSGGKIEADTIKVRSHNVSGTTVINERKSTIQRID